MSHTPTLVELYMAKAKVLKHAGDLRQAVEVLDYGRRLDLADRYINARTTKYLLRANRCTQAEQTIDLFVKSDKEYSLSLFELQCVWYEVEVGKVSSSQCIPLLCCFSVWVADLTEFACIFVQAQFRRGDIPAALKAYMSTDTHFREMIDDQYDFHSYCFRENRCNLQAYLEMLRTSDALRSHRYYTAGLLGTR